MKPQRILVTGGAGFIGSHTVDLLLAAGKEVRVLDNLFSGKIQNLDLSHPNLEFIEGDILEYPLLIDLLANCDAVLHLAAIVSVPFSIEHPIFSFQVNVQGLLHVLQAIRETHRPMRLVYASSAAVYGASAELPCLEATALSETPLSPYALQKRNDEQYAALYSQLFEAKCLGLRYFNVYGTRQAADSPYSGVISRFLAAYQQDEILKVYGDGQQSRDFIHVSEVAKANLLALESDFQGVLNIATGQPQTLLQLIHYLEAEGGKPAQTQFLPAREGDIKHSYAATEMAQKALRFQASMSLQAGIHTLLHPATNENP